jgi:WD40 repeat protein
MFLRVFQFVLQSHRVTAIRNALLNLWGEEFRTQQFKGSCYVQFVGYNDEILDMKFLGSSEREAVVATNSSQVRLYDLTTMDCQLLSAHSGKYQGISPDFTNLEGFCRWKFRVCILYIYG